MDETPVTIMRVGDEQWPRFAITEGRHRFWTGDGWSSYLGDALLYDSQGEVLFAHSSLTHCPKDRRFFTGVILRLGNRGIGESEIADYMNRHFGCYLDDVEDDSWLEIQFYWDVLKEVR